MNTKVENPASTAHRLAIGGLLLLQFVGAVWVQLAIWGNRIFSAGSGETRSELEFFLLVISAAAIGSFVHAATSFASYVGNGKLSVRWGWWYMLRIPIGMALGVLLYCVVRGGLLTTSAGTSALSPFGMAAVGGMAGMFSKQAIDKLKETFDTLFRSSEDAARRDKLDNKLPKITAIKPTTVAVNQQNAKIQVLGSDLAKGTIIFLSTEPLAEAVAIDGGLEATIPVKLLAAATNHRISIQTPGGKRIETEFYLVVA
jgi:hypothetical protein